MSSNQYFDNASEKGDKDAFKSRNIHDEVFRSTSSVKSPVEVRPVVKSVSKPKPVETKKEDDDDIFRQAGLLDDAANASVQQPKNAPKVQKSVIKKVVAKVEEVSDQPQDWDF